MARKTFPSLLTALCWSTVAASAQAGEPAVDKNQFHLFRPDSGCADAGNGDGSTGQDRECLHRRCRPFPGRNGPAQCTPTTGQSDEKVEGLAIAASNLKVGVLNNLDLQIIVETYNLQRTKDRDTGESSRLSGFGDLTLRSKINLWGNDGGPSALSVMPFVKLPTAGDDLGNGAVEGGVIFPFAMELPGRVGPWRANRDRPFARLKRVGLPPGVLKYCRGQPRPR